MSDARRNCRLVPATLSLSILVLFSANGPVLGTTPPPTFQGVTCQATVSWDGTSGQYVYNYVLTDPPANTLAVSRLELETPAGLVDPPVQTFGPNGWFLSKAAMWGYLVNGPPLSPGRTLSGFGLQSGIIPSIRMMKLTPDVFPYLEALLAERESHGLELAPDEQLSIQEQTVCRVTTLGPLGVQPGSFSHWDTFLSDAGKLGQLGWITDGALLSTIQTNLTAARQAALDQDQATANARLQSVIDAIQAATSSQRTGEGYALVLYNAQYLQVNLPWPCEPKLKLLPASASHPIGEVHTVTATLINVANGQPIANDPITFSVTDGPNAGLTSEIPTDATGIAKFSYTGTSVGEDTITARTPQGTLAPATPKAAGRRQSAKAASGQRQSSLCFATDTYSEPVKVKWEGGPDLLVTLFTPPMLISAPGSQFVVYEQTSNEGSLPAGPSVTRYYISTTTPLDPATALVFGQRTVPALDPGADSRVEGMTFTIPPDLAPGTYYLAACADAGGTIVETNEDNNCSYSGLIANGTIIGGRLSGRPPDCTHATASPAILWPPDHKLASIAITGVTDPDGDPVTITVVSITQDEPLNGLGDGDTCPDGFGVGTSRPQLRAERSGLGNGRVYAITFKADDGKGGSCTGAVTVGVSHDKKDTPVDDGQKYDATKCQ